MPVGYPTNAFFYKGEWYNTDGEGAPVTVVTDPLTGGRKILGPNGKTMFEVSATGEIQSALAADGIPELAPTDWYGDCLLAADATYLYGMSSSEFRDFVRINKTTRAREVVGAVAAGWGLVASSGIRAIVATSTPGTLILAFGNPSSGGAAMKIYRSTDYGSTWALVLTLGTGDANSPSTGVWMLSDRNFCEGKNGWYIGEYNVNSSRTPGGANDAVVVWKSTDKGATWSPVIKFNVGAALIRHIHALRYYDNRVYICCGDSAIESAIIAWDEVTPISNTAFASIPASCPVLYGSQAFRVVDLIFPGDGYAYAMTDATTGNENDYGNCGWYRYPLGVSGNVSQRLDGEITAHKDRSAYYGAMASTGHLVWAESFETGTPQTGDFALGVYVSNASRTRFARAGVFRLDTTVTGNNPPGLLFQDGNTIYFCQKSKALGKGSVGTAVFKVDTDKEYSGIRPDAVHPAYWVDPVNGVDDATANRGFSPALPWKTLAYALASNRVMQGGRVVLPAGTFAETVATASEISFDTTNADTTEYTVVEGRGKNLTKIGAAADSGTAQHFYQRTKATNLEWKDIHLTTFRAVSTQALISFSAATTAQKVRAIRARMGGRDIGSLGNIIFNGSGWAGSTLEFKTYDSEFVAFYVGAADLLVTGADMPVTVIDARSVFDGGKRVMTMNGTCSFVGVDTKIFGQTSEPFNIAAGASNVPVLVRPKISQQFGIASLLNTAALTLSGQFKAAKHISALSPAGVFDADSVIDPSVSPKNPVGFEY